MWDPVTERGGCRRLTNSKGFWMYNRQASIENPIQEEPRFPSVLSQSCSWSRSGTPQPPTATVSNAAGNACALQSCSWCLLMFLRTVLCSLVSEHITRHLALCLPPPLQHNQSLSEAPGSESNCCAQLKRCYSVCTQHFVLTEQGVQRTNFLIFSSHHPSAYKYQISMSLDWILFSQTVRS